MSERIKCEVCGRSWHDSVAGECPLKPGHFICMYCCRSNCKRSYISDGMHGCRAKDRARDEAKKGGSKRDNDHDSVR